MSNEITLKANVVNYEELDRSNWPAGEWDTEPDEEVWVEDNIFCVVRRTGWGHLCGYIGVSSDNYLYRYSEDLLERILPSHGGITYCSTDYEHSIRWIGFDCNHFDDLSPSCDGYTSSCAEYRNFDYVRSVVKEMADVALKKEIESAE